MIAILLLPLTAIYALAIYVWDFYWKRKKGVRVRAKVVSIGGITAGGSGKTSLAGYVAGQFLAAGLRTAVVAKGYGRKKTGPVDFDSDEPSLWENCGDEPLALARSIPGLRVFVDRDKTTAALRAAENGYAAIIVDDGFQHRRLARDINIVCIDGKRPFGNGHLLPSGRLREPVRSLSRADIIVIMDESGENAGLERMLPRNVNLFRATRQLKSVRALPRGGGPHLGQGEEIDIKGMKVVAFCGVGNPQSFRSTLERSGCEIVEFVMLRDHHAYSQTDIKRIERICLDSGARLAVTTLKDAVRLERLWQDGFPLGIVEIEIELEREQEFLRLILG